ncbi:MAG TPA: sugar kinase [Symbiobacteriaceae bacterium]|nr:sugar kinase [Symbiobacteriaceae bacterium]
MNKQVVGFGEIMARLSPPGYSRIVQATSLEVEYAGAEANALVSLAQFGVESYFVTKLPENPLGQAAAGALRRFGVDTRHVLWGGDRLGLYFVEKGASQRASVVIYDRAGSAIAGIQPGEVDWRQVLAGKDWLHFTGITPALGAGPAEATLEAVRCARELGLQVSCDLNYRSKLWSREKAGQVLAGLMEYVDLAVVSHWDAQLLFGIGPDAAEVNGGSLTEKGLRQVSQRLAERFGHKLVAMTLREQYSASENGWSAVLYDGKELYRSREYRMQIVERIGGGDAFSGAVIYGLLEGHDLQYALDFATAASCLKHTVPGDFNHVTVAEVAELVGGDGSGRVRR